MSIGAFYPCYMQPYATDKVLTYFKKLYPTAPVYMFNDGGSVALKYIAHKHGAFYHYHTHSADGKSKRGTYYNSTKNTLPYINNLILTAEKCNCDWIVLLEDDVLVRNKIHVRDLLYDVNGRNPDPLITNVHSEWDKTQQYLHSRNITTHKFYSANGGTIFRASFLKKLSNTSHQLDLFFTLYGNQSTPSSDEILFWLIQLNGGTAGTYGHYAYHWWPTNPLADALGLLHIIHGDKSMYH